MMKHTTAVATVLIFFSASTLSGPITPRDQVFSSKPHSVSFRFPANWSLRQPQLHTTIVLLYADDGSQATCNLNSASFPELAGLSPVSIDAYRRSNHSREYFESMLSTTFLGFRIIKHWRGYLGTAEAGLLEYTHDVISSDHRVPVHAFVGATFANGSRYTLNCNAPEPNRATAAAAFDSIRSSILFTY